MLTSLMDNMGQTKYKNILKIKRGPDPRERRENLYKEVLKDSTPLPNTLEYVDIDTAFKDWVEKDLSVVFEDKEIPTVALFSAQRFSEYMESWQDSDDHKNMLMNFKVITRENNPQTGTLHGGNMNIPGERTYLMKRVLTEDKNGRPYFLDYRMKQPFCVDLIYTISLVTNKYQLLNEFNMLMNKKFCAIQCYIRPNGHYLPMKLENISDESEYSMDDRQFFSQSFEIRVMAYIIQEDDLVTAECPILQFQCSDEGRQKNNTYVELEEIDPCEDKRDTPYYYQPVEIRMFFKGCENGVKFNMNGDFVFLGLNPDTDLFGINKVVEEPFKIKVNGVVKPIEQGLTFKDRDEIEIFNVEKVVRSDDAQIILGGYNPSVVYDERKDDVEVSIDKTQLVKEISIEHDDAPTP